MAQELKRIRINLVVLKFYEANILKMIRLIKDREIRVKNKR